MWREASNHIKAKMAFEIRMCARKSFVSHHGAVMLLLAVAVLSTTTRAFSTCRGQQKHSVRFQSVACDGHTPSDADFPSRRSLLLGLPFLLLSEESAQAVMMSSDSKEAKVFKAGQAMGSQEALARFQLAKQDLQYLIDHYDEIVASGGGDGVRRYLGTVGVTSALYGISKVMKELQEEADDIVEYTENMNEFDAALRAADTSCYSANFVEFSAASTKPAKFFADALVDIKKMMESITNMAVELKIEKS